MKHPNFEKPKNKGLGAKNPKLTANFSKCKYFEPIWWKIKKWNFSCKNLKNKGPGAKKTKYISKYLKTFGEKSEIWKFVGKI